MRDELTAQTMGYLRWVEIVAVLAYSTIVSHAERGTGPVPESRVVDALRTWLDPQTIGHFLRTLIGALLAANYLQIWSILAREDDWRCRSSGSPSECSCLPASEADSERAVGQVTESAFPRC
jgi:hypothetical protein